MGAHSRFLQHIDTVQHAGVADKAVEDLFTQIREMARERDEALAAIEQWKTEAEDSAKRAERAARQIELWKQQVAEHIMDLDRRLKTAEQGSGVLKHRNWFLEGTLKQVYEWYEANPQQLPDSLAMLLTASLLPTQVAASEEGSLGVREEFMLGPARDRLAPSPQPESGERRQA